MSQKTNEDLKGLKLRANFLDCWTSGGRCRVAWDACQCTHV